MSAAPSPAEGEGGTCRSDPSLERPSPWNLTPKGLPELSLERREQRERGTGVGGAQGGMRVLQGCGTGWDTGQSSPSFPPSPFD